MQKAAHYDLGNEMFQLFLDPTMMYSSAVFNQDTKTLQQASELKLKTICDKLDLKPSDHIIEIGTRWGGFEERSLGDVHMLLAKPDNRRSVLKRS